MSTLRRHHQPPPTSGDRPGDLPPRPTARSTTLVGLVGVAYVVLAAIEGLDALVVPTRDDPSAPVAAYLADQRGLVLATSACGALSLVAYLVAAFGLVRAMAAPPSVRGSGRTTSWPVVARVAAVAGVVASGSSVVARVAAVRSAAAGDAAAALERYRWSLDARVVGGVAVAVLLIAMACTARRSRAAPGWLATAALVTAAAIGAATVIDLLPTTLLDTTAARLSLVALGGSVLWMLVASVWLLLRGSTSAAVDPLAVIAARLVAGAVAVAAGVSGLALLSFPDATPDFFSWGLAPPPVATLIGGFYVASALVFGRGATRGWDGLRILMVGVVALAVPVFVATLVHVDVFDLGRLQSWVWIVLFGAFPLAAVSVLLAGPGGGGLAVPRSFGGWVALAVAVVAGVAAVALTVAPTGVGSLLPFALPAFAGRVVGGWLLLIATLAAARACTPGGRELSGLALVVFWAGALLGAARTADELAPTAGAVAYVLALVVLALAGIVVRRGPDRARPAPAGTPSADVGRATAATGEPARQLTGGTAGRGR